MSQFTPKGEKPVVQPRTPSIGSTEDDIAAKQAAAAFVDNLQQAIYEFRQANHIPENMGVVLRRNPEDGSLMMRAVSSPDEGFEALFGITRSTALPARECENETELSS